ncbi:MULTISPECIES: hypothetical protein [unclassified Bartonella]|uniref:hypothetical protein n=1 Tax=unclassified Bartonella TaxID=2645622 RepID=UPI0035D0DF3A
MLPVVWLSSARDDLRQMLPTLLAKIHPLGRAPPNEKVFGSIRTANWLNIHIYTDKARRYQDYEKL